MKRLSRGQNALGEEPKSIRKTRGSSSRKAIPLRGATWWHEMLWGGMFFVTVNVRTQHRERSRQTEDEALFLCWVKSGWKGKGRSTMKATGDPQKEKNKLALYGRPDGGPGTGRESGDSPPMPTAIQWQTLRGNTWVFQVIFSQVKSLLLQKPT